MIQEQYHKWYAQYLGRDMEMLVFGHSGYPVIIFPADKGRYYDAKDFGLINSAEQFLIEGKIKIYCPDSLDSESWYNYSINPEDRVTKYAAYEQSMINDVIEFAKFETGTESAALAGCGLGGYTALNIAFKYPTGVSHLFTMGAMFDIKKFIFGFYNDNCYYNNPPDYMPQLTDEWFLEKIRSINIIMGIGEWDENFEENNRMSEILNSININHTLDIWKWAGHGWNWWKEMFLKYAAEI